MNLCKECVEPDGLWCAFGNEEISGSQILIALVVLRLRSNRLCGNWFGVSIQKNAAKSLTILLVVGTRIAMLAIVVLSDAFSPSFLFFAVASQERVLLSSVADGN